MSFVEKLTSIPSFSACLVEIIIAPFLPLAPYKAEAAVPFNTLILAIFSLETSNMSDSMGTPSKTINGVCPRRENEGVSNILEGTETVKPAT